DPATTELRSPPRNERDLVIAATHAWIVAYDNLSHIPPWLSDSLCRLATGGGFGTRQLYTDAEETLFHVMRPVILNGIEELAREHDLIDRAIILSLPRIADAQRRPESELWAQFEEERPHLLGAL